MALFIFYDATSKKHFAANDDVALIPQMTFIFSSLIDINPDVQINDLLSTLDSIRHPDNTSLTIPSHNIIEELVRLFPQLFFYIAGTRPSFNSRDGHALYFPYTPEYSVYYDLLQNSHGISRTPYFSNRSGITFLGSVSFLEHKTNPAHLISALNFARLQLRDELFSEELVREQISLLPELFAI